MREVQSVSDTRLVVSGTIIIHIRVGESRTQLMYGLVDKLAVLVVLVMNFIDRFIMSIEPAEKDCLSQILADSGSDVSRGRESNREEHAGYPPTYQTRSCNVVDAHQW